MLLLFRQNWQPAVMNWDVDGYSFKFVFFVTITEFNVHIKLPSPLLSSTTETQFTLLQCRQICRANDCSISTNSYSQFSYHFQLYLHHINLERSLQLDYFLQWGSTVFTRRPTYHIYCITVFLSRTISDTIQPWTIQS